MKIAGFGSYAEAERELLSNGRFAPTQNVIQRKRTEVVRLPSDRMKKVITGKNARDADC